ncbi:GNAT family N-acetyltransferase [Flavobacterium sp. SM2513]|uniref:GNAT family N-acetyltransferase n=1 Tax=Flavobacterium sp. SM2513 TaxID=3424766 RepID=UPI003D7FB990
MKIEALEWDSNFFNLRIGRLIIENQQDFDVQEFILQSTLNFDLIYVISNFKMLNAKIVDACKLNLTEIMVTMSKPFNKDLYLNEDAPYDFRNEFTENELKECYGIAEQVASVSRFNHEPLIGEKLTKSLYRKWIDNAVNASFADGIFVEKNNENIIGIHLIKTSHEEQIGRFTLTAIDQKFNRMGLGSKIWNQSYNYWAKNSNINKILSPFSFQNKESLNFHLKAGFNKVEDLKYIYHLTTKKNDTI